MRQSITYEIDLSEAFDFSLFLCGKYQPHITNNKLLALPKDAIIFDVGANFGLMSLPFAKSVLDGKVYAFEPTHYAFHKLKSNCALNPKLSERIFPFQLFFSSSSNHNPNITAYSSWKIDSSARDQHPIHCGLKQSSDGIEAVSIDYFCQNHDITRLDLIKIDTDGHEWEVLIGAKETITKFRPKIIFECALYLLKENKTEFVQYYEYFQNKNYLLFNGSNAKPIDMDNYLKQIPLYGTVDIFAIPQLALSEA